MNTTPTELREHRVALLEAANNRHGHADDGVAQLRPTTDLGNAETIADLCGADLHYSHVAGCWYVWDGQRFAIDRTGRLERLAGAAARWRLAAATDTTDSDQRARQVKHALRSESRAAITAAVELAKSIPGIPVDPDAFDAAPYVLNVANGIIDLRSGELGQHRRDALCSLVTPIAYDPAAECPRFLGFLGEIFDGDQITIDYLRRVVGVALIGKVLEHIVVICHGTGSNGKSTLLNVLTRLFGEYQVATPAETFLARDRGRGGASPDVARMRGARLVTTSETGEGRRLDEAGVKHMTGGDRIIARNLYADYFEFEPRFTVVMATNHKPTITGTDHAIWRRIHLVPFDVVISPERRDPHLVDRLAGELPGILAWAVRGCLEYQRDGGLRPPERVQAATREYRAGQDQLGEFIDDSCDTAESATVTNPALYAAYQMWAGKGAWSHRRFTAAMRERGYEPTRSGKARGWVGIGLKVTDDRW